MQAAPKNACILKLNWNGACNILQTVLGQVDSDRFDKHLLVLVANAKRIS